MLFASDDDLRRAQIASARIPKGAVLSLEEQRREAMEADRELREHRRWREFAWLLFIAPIWAGLIIGAAQFIIAKLLAPPSSPGF